MRDDRGNRTYHVSDERLRQFARLTPAQKLAWVEQCSRFIRLARLKAPKPPAIDDTGVEEPRPNRV